MTCFLTQYLFFLIRRIAFIFNVQLRFRSPVYRRLAGVLQVRRQFIIMFLHLLFFFQYEKSDRFIFIIENTQIDSYSALRTNSFLQQISSIHVQIFVIIARSSSFFLSRDPKQDFFFLTNLCLNKQKLQTPREELCILIQNVS